MKIPKDIIEKLEKAAEGLFYGDVVLRLSLKQNKPRYVIDYVIEKGESIVPINDQSNVSVKEAHHDK